MFPRALPIALCAAGAAACAATGEADTVEIGLADMDGAFAAFLPSGECPLVPGPAGAAAARVALRLPEPPAGASARATVTIDGVAIGEGAAPAPALVAQPGGTVLLPGLDILFSRPPCCFACRPAEVRVEVTGAGGTVQRGRATVRFTRGPCPECCAGGEACDLPPPADCPAPLEIGEWQESGPFRPWSNGQDVRILTVQAQPGMAVAMRAAGADPRPPEVEAQVWVAGVQVAGPRAGPLTGLVADGGERRVLPSIMLLFDKAPCCVVCRDAWLWARMRDAAGREFGGSLRARLTVEGACPSEFPCCSARTCALPLEANPCR